MPFIKSNQNNADPVNIYYNDLGKGKNVVFIHGWPLNSEMWEYQVNELYKDFRCITYDRRGFGKSTWPSEGYDYDTLAGDLKSILDELDLQDVTLVGFSMGGGEIAKYFSLYGGERVSKVVLISAVVPYMLKTDSNPDGTPKEAFEKMAEKMLEDRPEFLKSFGKSFFGVGLVSHPVSDAFLDNNLVRAMNSSPIATVECAKSFAFTDFRKDVLNINVPALIIHGDADKTVPIEAAGHQSAKMITNSTFKIYEGAPHGLWFTEKEKLNQDLRDFI